MKAETTENGLWIYDDDGNPIDFITDIELKLKLDNIEISYWMLLENELKGILRQIKEIKKHKQKNK